MSFVLRRYLRFRVRCPLTYNTGPFQGKGTVWNFSRSGAATSLERRFSKVLSIHLQSQHDGGEAGSA